MWRIVAVGWLVAAPWASADDFFGSEKLYYFRITGWNATKLSSDSIQTPQPDEGANWRARLDVFKISPDEQAHCPDGAVKNAPPLFSSENFRMGSKGNTSKWDPKYPRRLDFPEEKFLGQWGRLNLHAMYKDPSYMREALAYGLFEYMKVPAPRHTYARLCVFGPNMPAGHGPYRGLYSVVEQINRDFIKFHFPKELSKGNLYAAQHTSEAIDLGPASLKYRGRRGDNYYRATDIDERTYQLKTNEKKSGDPALQTYGDLAKFIAVLNGKTIPRGDDFTKVSYNEELDSYFDAEGFLRWAVVNLLAGGWDNYWANGNNCFLYNSGTDEDFMVAPYFTWIAWDYDNAFGNDFIPGEGFSHTLWQYADIVDWPAATLNHHRGQRTSELPLISNVLRNPSYRKYYLTQMEKLLGARFNETWIAERIATLRKVTLPSAYLEADGGPESTRAPHTQRRYTNVEIKNHVERQWELHAGALKHEAILHYVRMRSESARRQLAKELGR